MNKTTAKKYDRLGRPLCIACGIPAHDGDCNPRDITVESVRLIVAAGIAHRRDSATTARLIAEALGI